MRVRVTFDEQGREDAPVFVISKAAELADMHPQTLRQYDRLGLVVPQRTAGRGRRYSQRDVNQLIEIQRLSLDEGINLAGITATEMDWFSEASGDTFHCRKIVK